MSTDDIKRAVEGATIVAFAPRATPARNETAMAAPPAPSAVPRSGQGESSQPGASGSGGGDGTGGRGDHGSGQDDGSLHERGARLPLTDLGNAERYALRYRGKLLWCAAIGWLWWDGKRWSRDGADEKVKAAEHATVRAIQDEARWLADSDFDLVITPGTDKKDPVLLSDKLRAWGRASESAARLGAIAKRAMAMMAIRIDAFDRDPMKINVANGTLRVRKVDDGPYVVLRPHDPADFITKLSPIAYEPDAVCPLWRAFLARVQPKADDQRFLAQWGGVSLTGDTGDQKVVFLYGKGRNGKGVYVTTLSFIAGDYADAIGIESFLDSGRARAGGQATPDLAGLPGVRMLTTSEPKKGATLDEAFVKLFTGGDVIKARHLMRDYFAFVPVAKLTMQGNYRPRVPGTDEGIWGRLRLHPWDTFIPADERDPKLAEKLRDEAPGILNWLLDGLRDWLDHGLIEPDSMKRATQAYREDSDPVGRFLSICTRQAIGKRVASADMHALFVAWAKANGETEWTPKGLAAALKDRGLTSKKSDTIFWLDLELTHQPWDFVDAEGRIVRPSRDDADDDDERET